MTVVEYNKIFNKELLLRLFRLLTFHWRTFVFLIVGTTLYTESEFFVYKSFLFGATAGTTAWIFIYPQDTIKTIIQSSADKKLDFISTGRKLVLNGYMNLYKGFSFCLLRVIPLHGTVFTAMELLKKYF